jgi:hypothetical protein
MHMATQHARLELRLSGAGITRLPTVLGSNDLVIEICILTVAVGEPRIAD